MSIIKIKNLTKKFEVEGHVITALDHIDLSVEEGDIFGIIGMSGAGKSTLVRSINYLEKPTEGEVLIEDVNLSDLTEKELRRIRSRIGMIFQNFNLLEQKNVLDNVCFPLEIGGVKRSEARKRALELLLLVGLEDKAKAYPSQLSGGQKQRVAIARALAMDPRILLCDEATSALDPQTTASILSLIKKINQELGITVVIITHQMSVVTDICEKVAIIDSGRLVESALQEVDAGVIEAARSMGASTLQIIFKVLLVEARTALLTGFTITTGLLLGYSAMSGTVGGGGLGDIAVRYGYYRWKTDIMIVTVVLLILIFQILQNIGTKVSAHFDHRKR